MSKKTLASMTTSMWIYNNMPIDVFHNFHKNLPCQTRCCLTSSCFVGHRALVVKHIRKRGFLIVEVRWPG